MPWRRRSNRNNNNSSSTSTNTNANADAANSTNSTNPTSSGEEKPNNLGGANRSGNGSRGRPENRKREGNPRRERGSGPNSSLGGSQGSSHGNSRGNSQGSNRGNSRGSRPGNRPSSSPSNSPISGPGNSQSNGRSDHRSDRQGEGQSSGQGDNSVLKRLYSPDDSRGSRNIRRRSPRSNNWREPFNDRPAPSNPIRTNQGIKARSQRGQFSQNWWARRWIESMEQLVDPGRLQRGRSYARSGQVLTLQETQFGVEAKVQGSRPTPYKVVIQVTPLTDEQWEQAIDALAEQALFTAQLLAGEMPSNIEDAFNAAGVSLFPSQSGDLFTSCSCPDWANPCKHVAATHYILGDRFDDDPFLIFRMRGRSQEQILQALRARRSGQAETEEVIEEPVETERCATLEESVDHFWDAAESLDSFPLTIRPASVDMPLLKRLGEPAFLGGVSLQEILLPAYQTFMRSALLAAYSDEEPTESNGQE